ncbi:hypothetical protein Mx8p67 [Myxococcus phage Mx8]|uniref:p67 n=1 Tax=Myxococcus phage Mx8 TaxID=49964 RepID=Q94MQ2_9CAUD|nr:hypothetical protein Mx8p67 [Myxococcus phage Mx8]AAK94402.1 p67 [Myxococcus phage Mx8]
MIALALVAALSLSQACEQGALPRRPTATARGDSIMFGYCNTTAPPTLVKAGLPGGLTGGWVVLNGAIVGETAPQIRARYVAEEATACVGERCAYLLLEGGVNSLRIGNAPAAVLAEMVWVVDDALAKGYGVVWTDVLPYAGNAGSGTDPLGQATAYNALWAAACAARLLYGAAVSRQLRRIR